MYTFLSTSYLFRGKNKVYNFFKVKIYKDTVFTDKEISREVAKIRRGGLLLFIYSSRVGGSREGALNFRYIKITIISSS